mmetsp:Transcript_106901/g.238636  ORF Transcript_106901/g.238636 Transcript_106901/m.238636 type:complete len:229 (+) Transcript_106901:108-794(+)
MLGALVAQDKARARIRAEAGEIRSGHLKSMQESRTKVKKLLADFDPTAFDVDGSKSVSREEMLPMLTALKVEHIGPEAEASQEDVDFLFALCDRKDGNNDNTLAKKEILNACEAWCAYLLRYPEIRARLSKFDNNGDTHIDEQELQAFLLELNNGVSVPSEVTAWVMKQADITCTGVLSEIELARAVCVWYAWAGKDDPEGAMLRIGGYVEKDESLPARRRSSVCALL